MRRLAAGTASMARWRRGVAKAASALIVRRRLARTAHSEGFTLLEVLVALAILGISLPILLSIFTQALTTQAMGAQAMAARRLAQTLIAQSLGATTLHPGQREGQAPMGRSWRLRIAPYDSTADNNGVKAVRISATVSWPGMHRRQSLTLTTLRLVPSGGSK